MKLGTLWNACAVRWSSVLWGIPTVLWGMFSIVGDSNSTVGYISVLWRDTTRKVEGYQQYGEGYPLLLGISYRYYVGISQVLGGNVESLNSTDGIHRHY